MRFKIGNIVKFKVNGKYIPDYYTFNLTGIIHGNICFKENKGIIKNIQDEYYLISYISEANREVILGFKEDVLEFLEGGNQEVNLVNKLIL